MEEQDQEEQTGSNQLSDNDGAAGILSQDELAINDNNNTKKVQGYSQGHLQRDETTLAVEPSSIVKEMSDIDGINGSTTDKLCNETIIRDDSSASNECDDSLAKVKLQLYETTPKHSDTESEYCDCKSMVSIDSKLEAAGNETFNDSLVDKAKSYSSSLSQSLKTPSCSSIHTFAQSTQSTLVDFCRICHCEGDAEVGPLIAPCYCRGSLRYVHQNCLQQWIKSSDSKHCELCGYHFVMDSKLKPFLKWKKLSMSTNERRKIMCSVMFHIIAITCVIWSLYVLIDKTTEEINNGNLQWPFWTKLVVVAIGFTGGLVFMYVQCKVYVQLWKRLKAFNRVIYVKNNSIKDRNTEDEGATDADSIGSNIEPRNTHSTSNSQGSTGGDGVVVIEICNQNSQL